MKRNMSETEDRISRLDGRRVATVAGKLKYSFFEIFVSQVAYYAVEIVGCGDSSLEVLGRDKTCAYELYRKLLRQKSTPCTLQEIVSDNFMEMKY